MMNFEEKKDFTLLILYKETKERGMVSIIEAFQSQGEYLQYAELEQIQQILTEGRLAVFQPERGKDYRGQITDEGVRFVENTSFSEPGKSILSLEEPEPYPTFESKEDYIKWLQQLIDDNAEKQNLFLEAENTYTSKLKSGDVDAELYNELMLKKQDWQISHNELYSALHYVRTIGLFQ
ncbi:MAG: hypothetical protein MUE96_11010 [Bacteroidia bacterium]|jgi:hypothetical protein|nr:hypothetical protein [Bacteroidia bacterium]